MATEYWPRFSRKDRRSGDVTATGQNSSQPVSQWPVAMSRGRRGKVAGRKTKQKVHQSEVQLGIVDDWQPGAIIKSLRTASA